MKLVSAPIWVILRGIPPQLFSLQGFSVIASGIGIPIHSEHAVPRTNPWGLAKVKVAVILGKKLPSKVTVYDKLGNSVTVDAEYPRVPPQCENCSEFGHQFLRCPLPPSQAIRSRIKQQSKEAMKEKVIPFKEQVAPRSAIPLSTSMEEVVSEIKDVASSSSSPSDGWIYVSRRSNHVPSSSCVSIPKSSAPLTSDQMISEERIIKEAQAVIRNRYHSLPPTNIVHRSSPSAKRRARRRFRKEAFARSMSDSDSHSIGQAAEDIGDASIGHRSSPQSLSGSPGSSPARNVQSLEA